MNLFEIQRGKISEFIADIEIYFLLFCFSILNRVTLHNIFFYFT